MDEVLVGKEWRDANIEISLKTVMVSVPADSAKFIGHAIFYSIFCLPQTSV